MLNPKFTKTFGKDVKRCQKRDKDMAKLKDVQAILIDEQPIPDKYRDHALSGDWSGHRECHIEPDWLLIYRIDNPDIFFERTGSHSDCFG